MAEQTGHSELDALIAEFAARPAIAPLRRSAEAMGSCEWASEAFVDLARGRGFDRAGREAYLSGDEWDGAVMVLERISPEDFGYYDRTVAGHNSHVVALVDLGAELVSIDFTAAQYGYPDFPLVQWLQSGDCWSRTPAPRAWTPATVGAQHG
jgi:hypothetical protein